MRQNRVLRTWTAPLARLGLAALAGAVLVGAPLGRALASGERTASVATDDRAPLAALGDRLAAKQRDAGDRMKDLVQQALDHTAQRMQEARLGMERVFTFGHGLEGLAGVDFSALEVEEEEEEPAAETADREEAEDEATVEPEQPRRFEYVEGTDDPLAGL